MTGDLIGLAALFLCILNRIEINRLKLRLQKPKEEP